MKTSVVRFTLLILALTPGLCAAQCSGTVTQVDALCTCTGLRYPTTACQGTLGTCDILFNHYKCGEDGGGSSCYVAAATKACLGSSIARGKGQDPEASIATCGDAPLFSPHKRDEIDLRDKLQIVSTSRKDAVRGSSF
jgi:hypothetical protein